MTTHLTTQQRDRAAGVLLATAAGDALGAGYEFTHPGANSVIDMVGGGHFGWAPGEWTDDTAMTVAIAEVAATGVSIGHTAGLDAVAAQFVRWFDTDPVDIGNQTRAVLSARPRTAAAMSARARALTGHKGGNGALMRTAPVALAYLDDARGAVEAAAAIALLTHDDERAVQACQLWTHAIRHAVLHGTFDGVREYLTVAPAAVARFWGPLLDEAEHGSPEDFANNGWVVHALQTAWWAITTTDASDARHLQRSLEAAVRAGGDTDTTAAIAGGLLGARWGGSAVPAQWRRKMHGWPGHTASDLVRLGVKIAHGGSDAVAGPLTEQRSTPTAPVIDPTAAVIDIVLGDITTLRVDAVVNAANASLLGGGGVDGAIHRVGGPQILAACTTLRATSLPDGLTVGAAVVTTAGNLPADAVIHTVGPRYSRHEDRSALLRSAYTSSLAAADAIGARTVAFPLISGGSYGWPTADAARQAVGAIREARSRVEIVTLVAYDNHTAALMRDALLSVPACRSGNS